jgi:hypothetical protein
VSYFEYVHTDEIREKMKAIRNQSLNAHASREDDDVSQAQSSCAHGPRYVMNAILRCATAALFSKLTHEPEVRCKAQSCHI